MSENKTYTNEDFFGLFRSKISEMSAESKIRYKKTLDQLDVFLTCHHLSLEKISAEMVADWVTEMLSKGISVGTVSNHLNFLSGMMKPVVMKGYIPTADCVRTTSRQLVDCKDNLPPLLNNADYQAVVGQLRKALAQADGNNPIEDVVLFSLLNGAMPLNEVALLKVDSLDAYDGISRTILERNVDRKRKYVFNLNQSALTPNQLEKSLSSGSEQLFGKYLKIESFDADEFVRSLWVAIAIHNGLSASEALALAGGSARYAVMLFNAPMAEPAAETAKKQWIKTVNAVLSHDMPRWYALRLRKGTDYDELKKEINRKIKPSPELFYPCEKIVKKTHNRRVIGEQPYITNTVFFKTFPECVQPMFNAIGDKAWCFRTHGEKRAPYATIPQAEMDRFQRAIGIFSSDTEVKPLGELSPKPGESVIVISAGFSGQTGTVEHIINKGCPSAIFRVKLDTDNGFEFRIDIDERQLERIIH